MRLLLIWIAGYFLQDGVIEDALVPLFGVGLTWALAVNVIFVVDCFWDVASEACALSCTVCGRFSSWTAKMILCFGLVNYVGQLLLLIEPLGNQLLKLSINLATLDLLSHVRCRQEAAQSFMQLPGEDLEDLYTVCRLELNTTSLETRCISCSREQQLWWLNSDSAHTLILGGTLGLGWLRKELHRNGWIDVNLHCNWGVILVLLISILGEVLWVPQQSLIQVLVIKESKWVSSAPRCGVSNALDSRRPFKIFIELLIFLRRHELTLISAQWIDLLYGSSFAALIDAWLTPDVTRVLVLPVIDLRFFIIYVFALCVIKVGATSLERCFVAWLFSDYHRWGRLVA